MTVAELIERLQQMPGELTVQYSDYEMGLTTPTVIEIQDYMPARSVVIR
jgi:hypothetical protein